MIKEFKHKGLEKFFLRGTKAGIQAKHAIRLKIILGRLNVSIAPQDMDLPGLKLRQLPRPKGRSLKQLKLTSLSASSTTRGR